MGAAQSGNDASKPANRVNNELTVVRARLGHALADLAIRIARENRPGRKRAEFRNEYDTPCVERKGDCLRAASGRYAMPGATSFQRILPKVECLGGQQQQRR